MRRVASAEMPGRQVLIDGVKFVQDDAWGLVLPRPDEPVCEVWAEGPTEERARALAADYARVVEEAVAGSES